MSKRKSRIKSGDHAAEPVGRIPTDPLRDGRLSGTALCLSGGGYPARRALPCPHRKTMKLALEPTRLKKLPKRRQKQLINWGYAACDAAIRSYAGTQADPPDDFPYPGAGVG